MGNDDQILAHNSDKQYSGLFDVMIQLNIQVVDKFYMASNIWVLQYANQNLLPLRNS